MTMPHTQADQHVRTIDLPVRKLTNEAFAAFGTVIAATEDGMPFGPHDAQLDLSQGTPRFYNMRLPGRGLCFNRITRHRTVTQALASVGGFDWLLAVAPPFALEDTSAEPRPQDIQAFRIPGDVAVMLHAGTWHAGPLFSAAEMSFFNLELADTNITDHHTCDLSIRYGIAMQLTESSP
jgi:ureidoglycolate hydrolase